MMQSLDTMQFNEYAPESKLKAGWISANIMPAYLMPMAGYAPRSQYEEVHDSLQVRTLAISNGNITAYLVSIDLLLFPPVLMDRVNVKLDQVGDENMFVYYSATHTHSGLGGWDPSLVGEFTMGSYHEEWIEATSNLIIDQFIKIKASMKYASLSYLEVDAPDYVYNRIDKKSAVDSKIRGIQIVCEDSSRAVMVSYSAHPTSLSSKSRVISGDFPAYMIEQLEVENNFGMFMAGMMGSHGLRENDQRGFELVENSGYALGKITADAVPWKVVDSVSITAKKIPVIHGPSQLRITRNFHVRDWIMQMGMRPLRAEITLLEIGDFVLLGTSCDFSGEIYARQSFEKTASDRGKKLLITSFNGNYTGYITADQHYETLDEDEVRIMNWVGPYFGQYYSDIIEKILLKLE